MGLRAWRTVSRGILVVRRWHYKATHLLDHHNIREEDAVEYPPISTFDIHMRCPVCDDLHAVKYQKLGALGYEGIYVGLCAQGMYVHGFDTAFNFD